MALGARPRKVLSAVLGHGVRLAGVGLLIGTPLAIVVVNMISGLITNSTEGFNVADGISAGSIVLPVAVLVGAGMIACLLPARRATRIDPARR